jgi:hypothetical protein
MRPTLHVVHVNYDLNYVVPHVCGLHISTRTGT